MPRKDKPLKGLSTTKAVEHLRSKGFEVEVTHKPTFRRHEDWASTATWEEVRDVSNPRPAIRQARFRDDIVEVPAKYKSQHPKYKNKEILRERNTSRQLGAYLYGKFPNAATRRVKRILRQTGTSKAKGEKAMHLISMSANKTFKAYRNRSRKGLLGLGLTAASLGSSIREANKE